MKHHLIMLSLPNTNLSTAPVPTLQCLSSWSPSKRTHFCRACRHDLMISQGQCCGQNKLSPQITAHQFCGQHAMIFDWTLFETQRRERVQLSNMCSYSSSAALTSCFFLVKVLLNMIFQSMIKVSSIWGKCIGVARGRKIMLRPGSTAGWFGRQIL